MLVMVELPDRIMRRPVIFFKKLCPAEVHDVDSVPPEPSLSKNEYKRERRDKDNDKKGSKTSVKYKDWKYNCHKAGIQMEELKENYGKAVIFQHIPGTVQQKTQVFSRGRKT